MKWLEEVTDMYGITRKELTSDAEIVLNIVGLAIGSIALIITVFWSSIFS